MTVYALDNDVLVFIDASGFSQTFAQLGRLPIVVTEIVWNEFLGPRVSPKQIPQRTALVSAIAGQPTVIMPQTSAAGTFAKIHPNFLATQDAGEHSIIAIAAHDEAIVPVFRDKGAIHRFVEELPRRMVLSVHGFLGALVQDGIISVATAKAISGVYLQRYAGSPLPLWWPPTAPAPAAQLHPG